MSYIQYNANPSHKNVGDCTVRAISKALQQSWEETYIGLALQGFIMGDMPSANHVWGAYLRAKGFTRRIVPDTCPDCYTVLEFAEEHPTWYLYFSFVRACCRRERRKLLRYVE